MFQTSLLLFSKELSDEEKNFWISFIDPIPAAALRYAFDNWNRNGRFFPKAKDISDLVEAYNLSKKGQQRFVPCGNCDNGWIRVFSGETVGGHPVDAKVGAVRKCSCNVGTPVSDHYGKGYGARDIEYLWKIFRVKREQLGRKLTRPEALALLDQLDAQRGSSPEWRKTA